LPLVPRLTADWAAHAASTTWQAREGTMAFADISGFTRLSEQLSELGAAGTEELTDLINACFESIVAAATGHGGDVLKIVGDGVLVWFEGAGHEERACAGCIDMHAALARPLTSSTGRPVRLRMSAGAHTGRFTFLMTAGRHRELVVAGSAVSEVLRCEKDALVGWQAGRWTGVASGRGRASGDTAPPAVAVARSRRLHPGLPTRAAGDRRPR
jgi:class 3 adenylate cyclase